MAGNWSSVARSREWDWLQLDRDRVSMRTGERTISSHRGVRSWLCSGQSRMESESDVTLLLEVDREFQVAFETPRQGRDAFSGYLHNYSLL